MGRPVEREGGEREGGERNGTIPTGRVRMDRIRVESWCVVSRADFYNIARARDRRSVKWCRGLLILAEWEHVKNGTLPIWYVAVSRAPDKPDEIHPDHTSGGRENWDEHEKQDPYWYGSCRWDEKPIPVIDYTGHNWFPHLAEWLSDVLDGRPAGFDGDIALTR